jgi:hypothetical protein
MPDIEIKAQTRLWGRLLTCAAVAQRRSHLPLRSPAHGAFTQARKLFLLSFHCRLPDSRPAALNAVLYPKAEKGVLFLSSPARVLANKTNAERSTGPVTPEGKIASSRNSLRHGLTAKTIVLSTEEQSEFDQLRETLQRHYAPANEVEREFVEALAQNKWRLDRLRRVEAAFLDHAVAKIREQCPDLTTDEALAFLFLDEAHAKKMRLFLRYQAPIEKAYNKTLRDLEVTQKSRKEAEKKRAVENAWVRSVLETRENRKAPEAGVGFVSQPPAAVHLPRSAGDGESSLTAA